MSLKKLVDLKNLADHNETHNSNYNNLLVRKHSAAIGTRRRVPFVQAFLVKHVTTVNTHPLARIIALTDAAVAISWPGASSKMSRTNWLAVRSSITHKFHDDETERPNWKHHFIHHHKLHSG